MKPSRKSRSKNVKKSQDARDSKNVKKLQDVRDKSLSKICDFFKVSEETPNPTVKTDEINNNVTANPKQFYVKELTKRIRSENSQKPTEDEGPTAVNLENHKDDAILENVGSSITVKDDYVCTGCVDKETLIQAQVMKISELEAKFKEMQKRYLKVTAYCTEVNIKYEHLLKAGTRTGQPEDDEQSFIDDFFSPNEIKMLHGISLEKKNDSTFILQCLKFAYKKDLSVLGTRSLNGTSSSIAVSEEGGLIEVPGKVALTPEKVSRIRQLFMEAFE